MRGGFGNLPTQVVLKWSVPVDDQDHPIGTGPVVLVDTHGRPGLVYVWTVEPQEVPAQPSSRRARVYGTGHPVPANDVHLGSTVHQPSGLVWHVFGSPQ